MASIIPLGSKGYFHDMFQHTRGDSTTTYPLGSMQNMDDMNLGAGYDDVTAGWNSRINDHLEADVGVDWHKNGESAADSGPTDNDSAEPCTNNQGSTAGQLDPNLNMDSVGRYELDDQTAAATDDEWDFNQGRFEEDIVDSLTNNTLEGGSLNNTGEQPCFANEDFLAESENNLCYKGEITADGATKPYHVNGGRTRLVDRERTMSSTATLGSRETANDGNSTNYQRPVSDSTTHRQNQNPFQGYDQVPFDNSHHQSFFDDNPEGQNMSAPHHHQPAPQQPYDTYGERLNGTLRGGSQCTNEYGGPTLVRQPIPWDDNDLPPSIHGAPNANSIGGWPMHGQGYSNQDYPLDPNAAGNPDGGANGADIVANQDNAYRPLFLTEAHFNNRNAARELARAPSDYPYGNIPQQQHIISLLYSAIRNTTDVEDSEKVAAKFNDGSIPDKLIQETCWEIMIRCRESQELGLLVSDCQNVKHLVKDSFMARMMSAINTLKRSKAACRQAMAPSFLDRLADQPEEEIKRKCSNKRLNAVKTGQNKAGVQAIMNDCAEKNGLWKGPVPKKTKAAGATQAEAANQAVAAFPVERTIPVEVRESAGTRHRLDEGSEDGPARKRARR